MEIKGDVVTLEDFFEEPVISDVSGPFKDGTIVQNCSSPFHSLLLQNKHIFYSETFNFLPESTFFIIIFILFPPLKPIC